MWELMLGKGLDGIWCIINCSLRCWKNSSGKYRVCRCTSFTLDMVINDRAASIWTRSHPLKPKMPDFVIAALSTHVYRRKILSISSTTLSEVGIRLKIVNDEDHRFQTPSGKPLGWPFGLVLAPSTLANVSVKPLVAVPIFNPPSAIVNFQSKAFVQVPASA